MRLQICILLLGYTTFYLCSYICSSLWEGLAVRQVQMNQLYAFIIECSSSLFLPLLLSGEGLMYKGDIYKLICCSRK